VAVVSNGAEETGSSSRSSTERRKASKFNEHEPFFTGQHKGKKEKKTVLRNSVALEKAVMVIVTCFVFVM